ncbi:Holliday junction branch migration protein RuvA [Spirochaetota bacterium]
MYDYISGKIIQKELNTAVIENSGIGYRVFISLYTFQKISLGSDEKIYIYYSHTENDVMLFGFSTGHERDVFRRLLSVSGIGPKLAIKILSGSSPKELINMIAAKNVERLVKIPGLGAKTAQKVVYELYDKFKDAATGDEAAGNDDEAMLDDVKNALKNLGYKEGDINTALKEIFKNAASVTIEEAIREALKELSR